MSAFGDSTSTCFWCLGPFRGCGGILFDHEHRAIRTCIECAIGAGRKMHEAGLQQRDAIEIAAFGHGRA